MKLVKYNPFRPVSFERFFDDFGTRGFADLMKSDFVNSHPSVNIIESEGGFDIEVAAPGLSKEDFNVEIDKDQLIISASKESSSESKENGNYSRREFNYSSFKRTFHLSDQISTEDVNAKYENGVLVISLSKTPEATAVKKTIEIG